MRHNHLRELLLANRLRAEGGALRAELDRLS